MSAAAFKKTQWPLEPLEPEFGPPRTLEPAPERLIAEEPAAQEANRRGPMRPAQLAPSRARLTGAPLTFTIKTLDLLLITAVAVLTLEVSSPLALSETTLAGFAPYALAVVLMAWALRAVRAYTFRVRESLSRQGARVVVAGLLSALAAMAILGPIYGSELIAARLGPVFFSATTLAMAVHIVGLAMVRRLRARGRLTANIVIVGAGRNAEKMIEGALNSGDVNILGVFDDRADRAPRTIHGVPVLGGTEDLMAHRILPFVDKIVIAVPSAAQARVRQIVEKLGVLPNPIALIVDVDGELQKDAFARIADAPLTFVSGAPNDARRAMVKRAQDLVIGSIALVVFAPVMLLTAMAVKLDSPGPAFFRQRRHGFNNEEIVVWKFRSMRTEVSDARAERQVSENDDRVTRFGRFIRRTSLDELPQIFNVLSGEMSLVGPRPHAIGMKTGDVESARLVAEYAHRHRMKPGITGWAAIKGSRGAVDTPEAVRRRVALDVEYIERQSFWLDLYIMLVTIPCLLGDSETVR